MTAQDTNLSEDSIRLFSRQAKDKGYSDEEIYSYLQGKNEVQEFKQKAAEQAIPEPQVREYLGDKLGIQTKKKPNLLQKSLELMAGPLPAIGEALGIQSLADLKALPGAFLSGAAGAPRSLLDFPQQLSQAQIEHDYPGTQQVPSATGNRFLDLRPETAYVPPGDEIPEHGDIGPLIRALLPSAQQSTETLVGETSMPKTPVGEAAFRTAQMAGGGAAGGPLGLATGGGIGALDYLLEQAGVSPVARAAGETLIGAVPGKQIAKRGLERVTGETFPPKPPPPPTDVIPSITEQAGKIAADTTKRWLKDTKQSLKSKSINSLNDLAAKVLIRDPENVNLQTIADLKAVGIDPAEVPLQVYTKGGLPNLLEGAQENSLFGGKRFKEITEQFTKEMTQRADAILDTFPIEEINTAVNEESLGAPKFDNYVAQTFDELAPQLNLRQREVGEIAKSAITDLDTSLQKQAKDLYDSVQFTDTDAIYGDNPNYNSLRNKIAEVEKKLSGEGFIGEKSGARAVLNKVKELYKQEIKKDLITGAKLVKEPIKYSDLKDNLQALNSAMNYENPAIMNLLMPVANEIRAILSRESISNPKLIPFLQAQEIFGQRARLMNDPTFRKLYNKTDEQFAREITKPTNMAAYEKFANETNNLPAYDNLRGAALANELRPSFAAETPEQYASSLTSSKLAKLRELEPFFPEYENMVEGLQQSKEHAQNFVTPEEQIKSSIRQDLINSQISGEIPSKTLKIMDTPKGIDLTRETLIQTPQGESLYKSLARKKLEQIIYDGTKKTEINFSDLGNIFKDEKSVAILENILDSKTFHDLELLSRVSESFQEGKLVAESSKKYMQKALVGGMGLSAASFLFGPGIGGPISAATIGASTLANILISKNFRRSALKRIEKISSTPKKKD